MAGSPSATGLTEKFDDLGFDLVEMVLADQGTWDRHATAQWLAVRRRLDENPADELAAEMPADLRTPGVGTCCTSASTAAGASSR